MHSNSKVGIDKMGFYWPGQCVPTSPLATLRGQPPKKIIHGLGIESFVVPLPFEDAVSMAANALDDLLSQKGVDPLDIGRLVVATETANDHAKPIAVRLHGLFNLPPRCEVFDLKFACVSGTYGLLDAVDFCTRTGKRAVVITTDIARYGKASSAEFTQGAGAVAMLVAPNPGLLHIDAANTGTHTSDEGDFFRPVGKEEPVVRGAYSVESYFKGLEAVDHVRMMRTPPCLFATQDAQALDYVLFHSPYPALPRKALARVIGQEPVSATARQALDQGLEASLMPARTLGNLYTASLFCALGSLIAAYGGALAGKQVGMYSFGSGSGSKFFIAQGVCDEVSVAHCLRSMASVKELRQLTVEQYETLRYEQAIPTSLAPLDYSGWRLRRVDSSGYRHYRKD